MSENDSVGKRIDAWKSEMDPALQDERFLVFDFSGARPLDPNDIVNPYIPGKIYFGPLWPMNISTIDWISIGLMHKYQTAQAMKTQPHSQVVIDAMECCQLFESVEYFPGSPPGTILAMQASLGMAALFLPRDEKHTMWARRKLATIESNGYIYPYTYRTKMSDLFRDRTCMHWWLPNDEGYPPIIRSIRKFVEERTSRATDIPGQSLRDMKAVFATMNLDDSQPGMAPGLEKGKGPEMSVQSDQGWTSSTLSTGTLSMIGEIERDGSDSYDFGGPQEYGRNEHQSHLHAYEFSKPGGFS